MYYEAKTLTLAPVANAHEAATLIRSGNMEHYQVATWVDTTTQKPVFVVADGHIDNPFLEVAVLTLNADGKYIQIESLTNGWMKDAAQLEGYLIDAITTTINEKLRTKQLIIDKPTGKETASFTCGCCGNWFTGNVKQQQSFDQDAGYGICPDCMKYY